jgi:ribokinase
MSTAPKFDVIVCGSLHLDIVVNAPSLPRIDETAVGSAWKKVCGGKGGNQAVQAARAGAHTAIIGRVGDDEFGKTLIENLRKSHVDHAGVSIDPDHGTGMSVAILQDDGEYGAVIVSGSNTKIDPSALLAQWAALGGAKILILQNEIPDVANIAAARVARNSGAQVIFNAAPARELGGDLLGLVDVLIVNRIEAEAMCGQRVASRTSARTLMPTLTNKAKSVVITLGGEGVVVGTSEGDITEIEPISVKVKSTHGAGDCFVGVLAAQLASGATLIEACRTANSRAAAFVSGNSERHAEKH